MIWLTNDLAANGESSQATCVKWSFGSHCNTAVVTPYFPHSRSTLRNHTSCRADPINFMITTAPS